MGDFGLVEVDCWFGNVNEDATKGVEGAKGKTWLVGTTRWRGQKFAEKKTWILGWGLGGETKASTYLSQSSHECGCPPAAVRSSEPANSAMGLLHLSAADRWREFLPFHG